MAGDLASLRSGFDTFLSDLEPIQHAMGQAGKKSAHEQFEADLGGDRRFSGLRRKTPLSAGYDLGQPVSLNLRPKGLVMLADKGRRKTKRIYPRKRGGKSAVRVGTNIRAWSMSTPSAGKDTIDGILKRLETDVPKGVDEAIEDLFRSRFP